MVDNLKIVIKDKLGVTESALQNVWMDLACGEISKEKFKGVV